LSLLPCFFSCCCNCCCRICCCCCCSRPSILADGLVIATVVCAAVGVAVASKNVSVPSFRHKKKRYHLNM
jgi:hypothetical protein